METVKAPTLEMERVGEYHILSKLSQGGMAEVFLARSLSHQRQVVVKSLFRNAMGDEKLVAMLKQEARINASLSHPNVVQVLDLVDEGGRPFIVMEYLEGVNLRQVLHKAATLGRRVSPAVACRIMIDVLRGLGYAHNHTGEDGKPLGLVHRDATPANVFVTWNGNVKMIDFGVAKETRGKDRNLTRCGEIKGKVSYMSPEQIQRRPLDARSDLFSAGIILWELLTLRRLFARKSDYESLVAVCTEDVAPPSKYLPMLPRELDYICARALARDPEKRYNSAEEMIWDLEQLVMQYGWAATPEALRNELHLLFNQPQEEEEVELFHDLPPAREIELPTTRTQVRGEPQAIAALNDAPTDPSLYESWDDAARSYRARGRGVGIAAIAAACLLLGAAAAGLARQISNAPPMAAISVSSLGK